MIGNKNSYLRLTLPVLLALLVAPAQALAMDTDGYSAVTKFNLESHLSEEEREKERRANSPHNVDLIYRVAFGRAADVVQLLKQGADANMKNETGYSVLMTAITRKDEQAEPITRALLLYGANPNLSVIGGGYPVTEVVKSGRADVLKALIENRAALTYAVDEQGRDLKTLAETRGDQAILDVLNPALELEKSQIVTLKSPESFIKLIQEYAFLNCANEYLNYYISTSPENVDMTKFNKIVASNAEEIGNSSRRIKFTFKITDKELLQIGQSSKREVVRKLEAYENNHNRKINGVGTDKDLNNRCWKIAKNWNLRNLNRDSYKRYVQ